MPRRILSPRHVARRLPATLATLATAALAACGGADAATGLGDVVRGTFAGNVSGHVSRALSGVAFYGQVNEGGATGFAVGMGSLGTGQQTYGDLIVIGRDQAGVPAPGTYTLYNSASEAAQRSEQFLLVSTLKLPGGGNLMCNATTGTVTFRAVEGGRLAGSYTTQARCVDTANPTAQPSVTLAGSFDAAQSANVPSVARMPQEQAGLTGARATR
jgi:hypothetical protein